MRIPSNEIDVWRAGLDTVDRPSEAELPAEERERAARLLAGGVRGRWIAARWALREVLSRYLDQDPVDIELRFGAHGKPMLATHEASPLHFNLSHSEGLALIAVTGEGAVGVDLEWIKPRRNLLALADRALPPSEAAKVRSAAPESQLHAFHAAWVRREALAKCLGTGIAGAPEAPTGAQTSLEVAVSNLEVEPGFAAAVAVRGSEMPPLRHLRLR